VYFFLKKIRIILEQELSLI